MPSDGGRVRITGAASLPAGPASTSPMGVNPAALGVADCLWSDRGEQAT